ncbi:MAG: transglutaminase-like domain-containing protein [Pyrinomonadaceae bacterium]
MKIKTRIILLALFLVLAGVQAYLLLSLPYTTSSISWNAAEAGTKTDGPTPNFSVGGLQWDVGQYEKTEDLKPFRDFFNKNCAGLKGIESANCVSQNLLKDVPFGDPIVDIFTPSFCPTDEFEEHLKGKPGHCVCFSSITANTLLSVGIPARLVQILPGKKSGHNVVEVWDDRYGWVIFDPLNGSLFEDGGKYLSAVEAINKNDSLKRVKAPADLTGDEYLVNFYQGGMPFDGSITYPEPWLYTRVSERNSRIWRGSFEFFGKQRPLFITELTVFRIGIIICLSLALIIFAGTSLQLLQKWRGRMNRE